MATAPIEPPTADTKNAPVFAGACMTIVASADKPYPKRSVVLVVVRRLARMSPV
jgi:hypothetical protein